MKQRAFRNALTTAVIAIVPVLFLVSCGGDGGEQQNVKTEAVPVIVVAIDGLRADALGCYGAAAATPAFDALAAESLLFEWAFAQAPQIQPSLATLFSGLYPTTNGLRAPGDYMVDESSTLAEVLGAARYTTAAFIEGGASDSDYGLAQGFDSYQTSANPGGAAADWMAANAGENFLLVVGGWSRVALDQVNALLDGSGRPEGMSDRVQEVLASRATGGTAAFDEADLEWARAWYAARVQVIDSRLGAFLQEVRQLGLDQRAIVVVLGSNGFALQEHGDLFGESLYPQVTHVPLMIRLPGGSDVQRISKVVEVVDLMPTILDITGQPVPAGVQGASLVPILDGAGQPPYVAFAESSQGGGQRFIAFGGMAMVSDVAGDEGALFDLGIDPLAADDVAESQGEKVDVMVRHLQAWEKMVAVASLDPQLRTEEDLDEDTLKQLKSLGYIQ
jgi:arylsulfatase A-like enzyme